MKLIIISNNSLLFYFNCHFVFGCVVTSFETLLLVANHDVTLLKIIFRSHLDTVITICSTVDRFKLTEMNRSTINVFHKQTNVVQHSKASMNE